MTSSILNTKKVVSLSLMIVILSLASIPLQTSFAASRTVAVAADDTITITYRDFDSPDPDPASEPVAFLDKTHYHIGETAILTIDDFNGDLNVDEKDKVFPLVNGQPIELEETEVNSHVFVGDFQYPGSTSITYTPDPPE